MTGLNQICSLQLLLLTLCCLMFTDCFAFRNQPKLFTEKIPNTANIWTKKREKKLESSTVDVYCFDGEEKSMFKLWKSVTLRFHIREDASYELFEEPTAERVFTMYKESRRSWFSFLPVKTTEISVSLFNKTCIGIATSEPYQVSRHSKALYSLYFISTILSVLLFYSAKRLSKNAALYYGTGVGVGLLASFLILIFIVGRFIPGRKAGLVFLVTGGSLFLAGVQYLWQTHVLSLLESYYDVILAYFVLSALLTFIFLYWYGPPTNPRTLDIVQWTIQAIALALLYYSIQVREVAISAIFILISLYNFPLSILNRLYTFWIFHFPPKRKLLTLDEYEQEADEFTRKSLAELRSFCKSPDCDAWKTISRLKTPTRFAEFVEGSSHIQDEELLAYDSGDIALSTPSTSSDSDEDINFHLSTR